MISIVEHPECFVAISHYSLVTQLGHWAQEFDNSKIIKRGIYSNLQRKIFGYYSIMSDKVEW